VPSAISRPATFVDLWSWVLGSAQLVARKPGYWLAFVVLLFALAVPITFVPLAGNYLRGFLGALFGAFAVALAHSQAGEGRISVRRSFSIVVRAFPALVLLSLIQVAVNAAGELPVLRVIATDREFSIYALSDMHAGPARFGVDLVHTTIVAVVSSVLGFAVPLVLLSGASAFESIRGSATAFAKAPAVYLTFVLLGLVLPHSLVTLGLPGILVFFAVAFLLTPAQYLMYRSVFGTGAQALAATLAG